MFHRLKSYLQEAIQEFHRVNWPTKKETARLTLVVIIFSLIMAMFLGVLDSLFTALLKEFFI